MFCIVELRSRRHTEKLTSNDDGMVVSCRAVRSSLVLATDSIVISLLPVPTVSVAADVNMLSVDPVGSTEPVRRSTKQHKIRPKHRAGVSIFYNTLE